MLFYKKSGATTDKPIFACWFGNFYEPYFSDIKKCKEGINELKELGFNNVILDSKLWSDFSAFFRGEPPSKYVSMQIEIINACRQHRLGVTFLALYCYGDNLYPDVYDNPPEYVDQPVDLYGNKYRGYRHWSTAQQGRQIRHCLDLYNKLAKDTAAIASDENGRDRLPFYFYHDPIFSPTFDTDGINHYLDWLVNKYSPRLLSERYGLDITDIRQMTPDQYWLYPEKAARRWDVPTEEDYKNNTAAIFKYADNQLYKMQVMNNMFTDLAEKLKRKESRFFLYSSISQWKYFFNDCKDAWYWDASRRSIDIWHAGRSLDCPSFTTLPADCWSQPNSYVVSAELAMLRSATQFKDFIAGLFLGRYLYNDIYSVYTPEEIIATAYAAGAADLYFYGYNGLDDGGNFGKWPAEKKDSIKNGLDCFIKLRKISGKRLRDNKAAIVFPLATFALHHAGYDWQRYSKYRHDLLGWYKQFADLGINCDILHPDQVKKGMLDDYEIAICPADPMYYAMMDKELENIINNFVCNGKTLFHSASSDAHKFFQIPYEAHAPDSITWRENITTDSQLFLNFHEGETIAKYRGDGSAAIVANKVAKGMVYSFGFDYGYAYAANVHLPSPAKYGKENHYPLAMLERTPVETIIAGHFNKTRVNRDIEIVAFEKGTLIVNHSSYGYKLKLKSGETRLKTIECKNMDILTGHNCAFITKAKE